MQQKKTSPTPKLRQLGLTCVALGSLTFPTLGFPQDGLVIRVGLDPDFAPYEFKDTFGEPDGFASELTQAIARELHFKVKFEIAPWSELVERLQAHQIDVLQGIFISAERARDFTFSNPYDVIAYDAFVPEDKPRITSLAAMRDLRIAVKQRKDTGHVYLAQEKIGRELREIQSYNDAFQLLRTGAVDAAFLVRRPALYVMNQQSVTDVAASNLLALSRRYGYGFRVDEEKLPILFNDGLAVLRQNGTYQILYDKWLALSPPHDQTLLERARGLIVAFAVLVTAAGLIVLWQVNLRRRVREETRELRELTELQGRAQKLLLEAKQQAEEASELKSELLGTVSHEIRTPFNGMIGVIELLLSSSLTGDQRELVEVLNHSAAQLMTLVNQILDFSRLERGVWAIEKRETRLDELVHRVAELYRPRAQALGLSLEVALEGDPQGRVCLDAPKVEQVLRNLVDNALKFTERGGVVIQAQIPSPNPRAELLLSVVDTGIGIAPDKQHLLFTKFGQIERGLSRKHGGVGLGLAISRRLAEAMQGRLDVESEPGRGSRFILTLPVGESNPQT